ncbi:hypothetical protein [Mycobacterium tuberculosis]|uniref:hypothetical protein n=1 Tax=Mycobacterium tuberculosis TaxID=1773 RepID=UPI00272C2D1F|nr:hypothetical protein [Mycobacterium tuberculosis]
MPDVFSSKVPNENSPVYRALENQVRELQRMLGKKTMENEILREAISRVAGRSEAGALD